MKAVLRSCALVAVIAASGCVPGAPRPNVAILLVDTLRANGLQSYGAPVASSPEIDELATSGVRFAEVLSQCTWTRPSIGSMLTSLQPRELGLYKRYDQILADRFTTLAELFREAGYATIGATANPVINSYYNFDQGFDRYMDSNVIEPWMPRQGSQQILALEAKHLQRAAETLDKVKAALWQERDRGPYFIFVDLMDVHEFYRDPPGPDYAGLYPEIELQYTRQYLQAVRLVSREIGYFVSKLSERPGWENTIWVVTGDHGESLEADHTALAQPRYHGWLVYESQARVPLILYGTNDRLPRGRVVDERVRLIDLMPTLLELAGLDVPDGLAGRSLVPLIDGEGDPMDLPEHFVVETRYREAEKIALYGDEWEYVENRDGHEGTNPTELHSRGQQENGAQSDVSARFPDVADAYREALADWERANPPRDPTPPLHPPSPELIEQLRALGYVD